MKQIAKFIREIELLNKPIRIGFPDGNDPRILEVVKLLKDIKNIEPIIIEDEYIKNLDKNKIITIFQKVREGKNNTIQDFEKWVNIPNYVAMALLVNGDLDCVVGGATTPTADLLRPALQIVQSRDKFITSYFWMNKEDENYFMADCAIIPNPNQDQIIKMVKLLDKDIKNIYSVDNHIALLSFSTNGSGGEADESILKMKNATIALKEEGYNVLGETQFDAAFDKTTRIIKWKNNNLSRPNIYVFPDLNSANIGYKIMKLTGGYEAVGPFILGLNLPVNDLSRGADIKEIFNTSIITILSAIKRKKNG
ncbi:MAG: phosphate acetyltransferase [Mycoplasma sp.]|nr:phosphate acetyltransferase [Mycoplasma sp.]